MRFSAPTRNPRQGGAADFGGTAGTRSAPRGAAPSTLRLLAAAGNQAMQKRLLQPASTPAVRTGDMGMDSAIQKERGAGRTMAASVRSPTEQVLGVDLSGVRVHDDANAGELSRSLNARAFTAGRDIFFKAGEYSPGTPDGRQLIAHELAHVVQQDGKAEQTPQRNGETKPDPRFQRRPPGAGALTEAEYRKWQRAHPNADSHYIGPWMGEVNYKVFTTEWFVARGLYYAGSVRGGYQGARYEIWLSDEGKGKEYMIFRGPPLVPPKTPEAPEEPLPDPDVEDVEEAQGYLNDSIDEQNRLIATAQELCKQTGTAGYNTDYAEYLKAEDGWRDGLDVAIERVKQLKAMAKEAHPDKDVPALDDVLKKLKELRDHWPCGAEWGCRKDLPPTPLDRRRYGCVTLTGKSGEKIEF